MSIDYSKLRGKIKEEFGTEGSFSKAMHMGRVSLSQRMNGKLDFTTSEIKLACRLLSIPEHEIPAYFFAIEVQKSKLA